MASVSVGFFRQPRYNVGRFGLRIVETGIKDDQWVYPAMIGNEHRRAGIEFFKTAKQRGFGKSGQIQFGQNNSVGDGDLLL